MIYQLQFSNEVLHSHPALLKGTVSPELIAKRWGIGIKTTKHTFNATAQLGVQDYTTRRLKHTAYQLKF